MPKRRASLRPRPAAAHRIHADQGNGPIRNHRHLEGFDPPLHTSQHNQAPDAAHPSLGRKSGLGIVAALVLVVAPQAPLGALTFGMAPNFDATGVLGFPLIFAVVGAILLTFGVAASAMAKQVAHPGGLYAYVSSGLGRRAGLGAALVGLVGYSAMPVTFFVPIGDQASRLLAKHTGLTVPWWVAVIPVVLAVGLLGTWSMRRIISMLGVLLGVQLFMIVAFDVAALLKPGPEGITAAAFDPSSLLSGGVSAALAFVLVAFVGFETIASYTGELRQSSPSPGRIAYLGVAMTAALYAFSCWALTVAAGPSHTVELAHSMRIAMVPSLVEKRLGSTASTLYSSLVLVSIFGAALAFHNVAARYLRALAKDGVLPRALASGKAPTGAPAAASAVQAGVSLALILITGLAGADPTATLFLWMSDIGALGICFVLVLASLAIVAFFLRSDSEESGFMGWEGPVVAGSLSAVTLTLIVIVALTQFDVRLGVPRDSPLGYLPPMLLAVVFTAGVVWASVLRSARPLIFARIGYSPPGQSTQFRARAVAVRPDSQPRHGSAEPEPLTTAGPWQEYGSSRH